MCDSTPEWKKERIQAVKASRQFFSNEHKLDREKWVVEKLLSSLLADFNESLLEEAAEPVDVRYISANFQVKEILQVDRKRGDEYKCALANAEQSVEYKDLLEQYTPRAISLAEIVKQCCEYSKTLISKYGPLERKHIDLLIYFNHIDTHEIHSSVDHAEQNDFRSLSVVSNSYAIVVYAKDSAPIFMKDNVGIVNSI